MPSVTLKEVQMHGQGQRPGQWDTEGSQGCCAWSCPLSLCPTWVLRGRQGPVHLGKRKMGGYGDRSGLTGRGGLPPPLGVWPIG